MMVASHPCGMCTGADLFPMPNRTVEPEHCHGASDMPAPPGVFGGYRCSCPCRIWQREGHMRWWKQAEHEHPTDDDARGLRYFDLMRKAGLIVKRKPGESDG